MMPIAKVITVIEVRSNRGTGKDETSPIRQVIEYYDFDGNFLAEQDPATYFISERNHAKR
jgi:hypothetical protein